MYDETMFKTIAMEIFKKAKPDLPAKHEEVFEEVMTAFKPNPVDNVLTEEVMNFEHFIKSWKFNVDMGQIDRVSVSLQIPMGQGFANIGLSAGFPVQFAEGDGMIETSATQASINATIRDLMNKIFVSYTGLKSFDGFGGKDNGALSQSNASAPPANNAERHTSESIVCNVQEGKRQYRIRAGWFKQYGAAVYEEVLLAAGIDPQSIANTSTPFVRQIDVVKNEKNQPKVVKIY